MVVPMLNLTSLQEVNALIAANEPESDVLEFKELISNSAAAKAIAAIANHRGGNLMFGVREENGRAAGLVPIGCLGASRKHRPRRRRRTSGANPDSPFARRRAKMEFFWYESNRVKEPLTSLTAKPSPDRDQRPDR